MKAFFRTTALITALLAIPLSASTALTTDKKAKEGDATKASETVSSSAPRQFNSQAPLVNGTPLVATIVATGAESGSAQAAISRALSRATTFDRELFTEGGIESQLAQLEVGKPLTLSPDVYAFFKKVVDLATLTGGWFDVTGPSSKSLFTKNDWRRLALDDKASTITLKSKGISLDLRRAAVGYEVDLALAQLVSDGFVNAMVEAGPVSRNIGHDIFTPWKVEIGFGDSTTEESKNAYRARQYAISNVAIATITPDGLGKGLIDPRNKKPVSSLGIRSLTIVAADALTATSYALAAYTVGPKFGLLFVEAHPETRGIMVDQQGNLMASRGFSIVRASNDEPTAQQAAVSGGPNDLRQKQNEESRDL